MTRRIIQIYRGTTAQNEAFTGAAGELTMDTSTNELRIHDGSTVGGTIVSNDKVKKGHELIAWQDPTAENNNTWYRKYADGWVEQGGRYGGWSGNGNRWVNFVVAMADTSYYASAFQIGGGNETNMNGFGVSSQTTTGMNIYVYTSVRSGFMWHVCGKAA